MAATNQLERLWGLTVGLLIGAGVFGHALRLVILEGDWAARHNVAGFAVLLYGVAALFTYLRHKLGLYITILGPLGGMTAVTLAPNASIDTFQFVLGIPQFMAIFLAAYILLKERTSG